MISEIFGLVNGDLDQYLGSIEAYFVCLLVK